MGLRAAARLERPTNGDLKFNNSLLSVLLRD